MLEMKENNEVKLYIISKFSCNYINFLFARDHALYKVAKYSCKNIFVNLRETKIF